MGNFVIPRFQYIINSDSQVQLYGDDGTGPAPYTAASDLLPTNSAHKFSMIGELDWLGTTQLQLLEAAIRVRKETADAGTHQVVEYTVAGTIDATNPALKGTVVRVITDQPSKEYTAYQNIPNEKRYQLPRNCVTLEEVAQAIVDVINADNAALVTAAVGTGGVFTLTDKFVKTRSLLYLGLDPDGNETAWTISTNVTTPGENPINTYEVLKDIQWSNSVDFDRNAEYYPEKGAKYTSYTFKIQGTEIASGGHTLPSKVPGTFETEYVFYVKEGLDFNTAMDAFAFDMNV